MRGRNRFLSVKPRKSGLRLEDNSSIAVIGGGPAGSFFSYFMLDMAERMGIKLRADIYEPRNFAADGPAGCNMCGGIISESLVQILAAEGINIPTTVVQHGIDSYIMHTDAGKVRIDTPLHESRIAAVHRGIGPKGVTGGKRESFDAFLLDLAEKKGARVYPHRVEEIRWTGGRPTMIRQDTEDKMYDLLVIATGVNSIFLKKTDTLPFDYIPPETTRTAICEFHLGEEMVNLNLGSSMHVFLLDLPRLEFAAIIPKKDYATVCLMGDKIDSELVNTFLHAPEVRKCFPPDWKPDKIACRCAPSINIEPARNYFGDRVVFIGDTAATRLYKDGIGAAYRTAKAAAMTAVFQGISAEDFRKGYAPECDRIKSDNAAGKRLFSFTGKIQKHKLTKRA
ncbi:MAG: hypothetical protein H8E46_02495, partial [FCB group bacterium]|nr:hypothetical protein [FCB group bacterium]